MIDETHRAEPFSAFVCLEIYKNGIFRLLAGMGEKEQEHHTVMMEGVPELEREPFVPEEQEGMLWIRTETCDGAVNLEDFEFSIFRKDRELRLPSGKP